MISADASFSRDLAEIAFDGVVICDLAGKVWYANPAARALYDWETTDPVGCGLDRFSMDPARWAVNWRTLLQAGAWEGEIGRTKGSGEIVLAAGRRHVFREAACADLRVIEFTRATSVLDRGLVLELRAQAHRNAQLIRHMPIPLWQFDIRPSAQALAELQAASSGRALRYLLANPSATASVLSKMIVLDVNFSAAALIRASEKDARTVSLVDFLNSPELAARFVASRLDGSRTFSAETTVRARDGSSVDVDFFASLPETDDLGGLMYVMATDVTERNRTTRQLRKLEINYSHAARVSTLGELASSIAHEVKQPLAAIKATAETSLAAIGAEGPGAPRVAELNQRILASAHRANDIIHRIRGMATKRDPISLMLDLQALLREACLFVEHEVKTKRIRFEVQISRTLPGVAGDPIQLQQVFVNLLVNAVQAVAKLEEGRREVTLRAEPLADEVLVEITDAGDGIPTEALPRLFDGFFSTKVDGVGIGLSICKTLVNAHNGVIEASSVAGAGASFRVRLPAATSGACSGRSSNDRRLAG